jgi:hypothetical protein
MRAKQFVTFPDQTSRRGEMRIIGDFLFLILFFALLGAWLLFWAAFHIAGGMIHLLLIVAVISLILHLFRGRSAA